jgi:hypothetical protein
MPAGLAGMFYPAAKSDRSLPQARAIGKRAPSGRRPESSAFRRTGSLEMIRKSMPSGHDPMGRNRSFLATNVERVCAEIMLKQ